MKSEEEGGKKLRLDRRWEMMKKEYGGIWIEGMCGGMRKMRY